MFVGAIALFGLVMALLTLTYVKPGLFSRLSAKHWIVGGGLVLPIPVLTLLTGTALVLGEQLLPRNDRPTQIYVTAEQWLWRFDYPNTAFVDDGTLHIPAGEVVDLQVTATDVIHSFWVPRLGGKIDAIPGRLNRFRIEASKPGVYWGQCAEYCDIGHDTMRFRVVAHERTAFDALMAGERQ